MAYLEDLELMVSKENVATLVNEEFLEMHWREHLVPLAL